jgi:hypothetical protein
MPEPLHVNRLSPEGGLRAVLGEDHELHVEMKSRRSVAEDLVPGKQRRLGIYRQIFETAFLGRLPYRRCLYGLVAGFQVTTCLKPSAEPGMQGQKHLLRRGGADQRARGQMCSWAVSRPAVRTVRKMINVQSPETILPGRGCPPSAQSTQAAVCEGGADGGEPGAAHCSSSR